MTLRHKIVSLTFGVLVIFAATVGASLLLQRAISKNFEAVIDGNVPLQAAIATIDVYTDRYELELLRLLADKPNLGAEFGARLRLVEATTGDIAELLTTTFQAIERTLSEVIRDPDMSVDERIAMANIGGRFSYMARALPEFLEVGSRFLDAVKSGHDDKAVQIAHGFTRYRTLFGADLSAVREQIAAMTARAVEQAAALQARLIVLEAVMLLSASLLGLGISVLMSSRMMAGMARAVRQVRRSADHRQPARPPEPSRHGRASGRDRVLLRHQGFQRVE